MKFLLSLSLIPLLLLTNVSAAEDLPLPTNEQENFPFHEYKNPTIKGIPLLALLEGEPDSGWPSKNNRIILERANTLCILLGHKGAGTVFKKDLQYYFEGDAYLDGHIVDVKVEYWKFWTYYNDTSAIFKTLRCVDFEKVHYNKKEAQ